MRFLVIQSSINTQVKDLSFDVQNTLECKCRKQTDNEKCDTPMKRESKNYELALWIIERLQTSQEMTRVGRSRLDS